jgi:hypothetical protein
LTDIELLKKHSLTHSDITEVSIRLKKMGLYKGDLLVNFEDLKKIVQGLIK